LSSSHRSLAEFKPVILDFTISLRPHELTWAKKYTHGVYAFLQQKDFEYFGICFHGEDLIRDRTKYPYLWQVPRKYHLDLPSAPQYSRSITCQYPIVPGTFVPLALRKEQLIVFSHLLAIAEAIANNDSLLLKERYEEFLAKYGMIRDYSSYFDSIWWVDLRLMTLFSTLEQVVKTEGSSRQVVKKDFAATKSKMPESEPELLNVTQALERCLSVCGQVDLQQIASLCALPESVVEEKLRKMQLIFISCI
jgi:hypothetical protein